MIDQYKSALCALIFLCTPYPKPSNNKQYLYPKSSNINYLHHYV